MLHDYFLNISNTVLMIFIKTHSLISATLPCTVLQSVLFEVTDLGIFITVWKTSKKFRQVYRK